MLLGHLFGQQVVLLEVLRAANRAVCAFQVPGTTLNPLLCSAFFFFSFFFPFGKSRVRGLRESRFPGRSLGAEPCPAPPRLSAAPPPRPPRRRPPACQPAPAPPQCFQLRAWAAAALDFREPGGSGKLTPTLALPRPRSTCSHEGTAQRVSAARPPRIAAVGALVARAGGEPRRPKLG